jgi:GTP-binding protein LepA
LVFEPESSALGRGFKCGFLGMLHLEIISERLKREFELNLIITTPSLTYKIMDKKGEEAIIYSAHQMPEPHLIEGIKELWAKLEILAPAQYLGKVMQLLENLEGIYKETKYLTSERLIVEYEVPLREIIVDYYDKLKSATSGYASMSYEILDWQKGDLVCLDILIAGEKEEAFSKIVSRQKAQHEGRALVEKLKEAIPPQLFAVSLQAAINGKIIARENIRALRKDVTGYLYGGDYTRKRKLLEKQKKGKKKMKAMGRVNIPQDAYLSVLKK